MKPYSNLAPQGRGIQAKSAGCLAAAIVSVALWVPVQRLGAAELQTKDKISSRVGVLQGGSRFTPDGAGHSGLAGDTGADFGASGSGPILVSDAAFMNVAAANDEVSFGFWSKKYDTAAGSAFWAVSPSSNNGERGFQAHLPWDNNNIYFDTVGCCNADQRINADIATFADYSGDRAWWNDWHYFVFSKKADNKQIWIDGKLFLEQATGAAPLPQDFTRLMIGSDYAGGGLFHAVIDDFSVFSTQLVEADIAALVAGTAPTALAASTGLLAYWDFNDPPSEGQFLTVSPAPKAATAAPNLIRVVHVDGATPWAQDNVSLKIDDIAVTPVVTKDGGTATVSFVPSPIFAIQSTHKAALAYPAGGQTKTLEWSFTVAAYTRDSVAGRTGVLTGGSAYTSDTVGHSGLAGDYALDFGKNGSGPVVVNDAAFMNAAAANDEVSFGFWSKKYDIAAGSAFWAVSPASNNGERGFQAHLPWDNGHIYFDTAGCCNADQRLESDIATFADYSGDVTWWQDWHYFVFSKKVDNKQIWIDGKLFLEQATGAAPLPQDFTRLMIGSDNAGGGLFHAVIDDFSVFSTQLVEADIAALVAGTKASALPAAVGLLANWDFNDFPPQGLFVSTTPSPDSTDALPNLIKVVHQQGIPLWDLTKVSLKVDAVLVTPTLSLDEGKLTVAYVPSPLFAGKSTHSVALTYPGTGGLLTKSWQFTVGAYAKDVLHNYIGSLEGAAVFTEDAGGRSGNPGDLGVDLGPTQAGQSVHVLDASFLNEAAANDEMAIAGWQKLYSVHDSAFVWGVSPSSNGSRRGWGTHSPWSNNNLYFDTAGCCDASQRTSAGINSFPPYIEVNDVAWWNSWHYLVFQKKLATKEIWIDGQLFTTGQNDKPLPTDFTELYVGFDPADGARLQGVVDDIAVFKTALSPEDIAQLAGGAVPTSLPESTGLIAYWNFNDTAVVPLHIDSAVRNGASLTIGWSGSKAPYLLERKSSLSDPSWVKVLTTSIASATVAIQGKSGFFRVSDQAATTVQPFKASLNGASEKPNAVNTPATGTGSLSLEGNQLWYYLTYENLSAGATAAHIHGPASASQAAGVLQGLGTPTGTSGVLTGVLTLTDEQKAHVLAGNTYINIHTTANPGGEIRGQITP